MGLSCGFRVSDRDLRTASMPSLLGMLVYKLNLALDIHIHTYKLFLFTEAALMRDQ